MSIDKVLQDGEIESAMLNQWVHVTGQPGYRKKFEITNFKALAMGVFLLTCCTCSVYSLIAVHTEPSNQMFASIVSTISIVLFALASWMLAVQCISACYRFSGYSLREDLRVWKKDPLVLSQPAIGGDLETWQSLADDYLVCSIAEFLVFEKFYEGRRVNLFDSRRKEVKDLHQTLWRLGLVYEKYDRYFEKANELLRRKFSS